MDSAARSQLNSIVSELYQIARDLEKQANDLSSIQGVVAELCRLRLEATARKYRAAGNTLSWLD